MAGRILVRVYDTGGGVTGRRNDAVDQLEGTTMKKKGLPGDDEFGAIPDDELDEFEDEEEGEADELFEDEEFEDDEEFDEEEDFGDDFDDDSYEDDGDEDVEDEE